MFHIHFIVLCCCDWPHLSGSFHSGYSSAALFSFTSLWNFPFSDPSSERSLRKWQNERYFQNFFVALVKPNHCALPTMSEFAWIFGFLSFVNHFTMTFCADTFYLTDEVWSPPYLIFLWYNYSTYLSIELFALSKCGIF